MGRLLLATVAALFGAFVGAAVLAMALGILATKLGGTFEGSAAMGGATVGGIGGAAIGFGLSLWLVLRQGGRHGAVAFAWIAMTALVVAAMIAFIALSY